MYFLDDFLELLEPFTNQFQEDISQIGDLDKTFQSLNKQIKDKSDEMFEEAQRKRVAGVENVQSDPQIIQMYNEIKALHKKTKGAVITKDYTESFFIVGWIFCRDSGVRKFCIHACIFLSNFCEIWLKIGEIWLKLIKLENSFIDELCVPNCNNFFWGYFLTAYV